MALCPYTTKTHFYFHFCPVCIHFYFLPFKVSNHPVIASQETGKFFIPQVLIYILMWKNSSLFCPSSSGLLSTSVCTVRFFCTITSILKNYVSLLFKDTITYKSKIYSLYQVKWYFCVLENEHWCPKKPSNLLKLFPVIFS